MKTALDASRRRFLKNSGTALRFACAEARQILLELAAVKLAASAGALSVTDGTISGGAKQLTYWELASEGGIIQSASWTLKEQVGYDRQAITTRSWADYPILTFAEVPAVEVHLINRPEERSLGTGEGSQGPTVAAIANAVYHATGKRMRDLPFTPQRVKAALA